MLVNYLLKKMQRKLPIYKVSGKEKPPYKTKIFTKNEKEQKTTIIYRQDIGMEC